MICLDRFVDLCCVGIRVGDMYASMRNVFQNDTCIDMSKYVYMYTYVYICIYTYIYIYICFSHVSMFCICLHHISLALLVNVGGIAAKYRRHCRYVS